MTNDNPKSDCCGAEVIMSHCKACGKSLSWDEYTLPEWVMPCGHFDSFFNSKPTPSEPSSIRKEEKEAMTNDNTKCEHDHGDYWQSEKDGGCAKSFLKDCPFCFPNGKPSPSDPECKRLRESGNDLGRVYVPEPKCEHDGIYVWIGGVAGYMSKAMYETCPFFNPELRPINGVSYERRVIFTNTKNSAKQDPKAVEPSVESQEFYDLMQEYRHAPLVDQEMVVRKFEAVKKWVNNALRNERNRK